MALKLEPGARLVVATHNPGKARELAQILEGRFELVTAGELGLPEPEETESTFAGNALLKARAAADASGLVALADDSGLSVAALDGAPGVHSARWAGPAKDFALAMRRVEERVEEAGGEDFAAWFTCALAVAWPDGPAVVVEGRIDGALADDSGLSVAALDGAPGVHSARWAGPAKDFTLAMRRVEERVEEAGGEDLAAWFTCALAVAWPDGPAVVVEGRIDGALAFPPRGDKGFGYDPIFQPQGMTQTFGELDPEVKDAMSHRARAFAKLKAALL